MSSQAHQAADAPSQGENEAATPDLGSAAALGSLVEAAGPALLLVQDQRIIRATPAASKLLDPDGGRPLEGRAWPDDVLNQLDLVRARYASRRADGVPLTFRTQVAEGRRQVLTKILSTELNSTAIIVVSMIDITELREAMQAREWQADMHEQTEILCRSGSIERDFVSGRVDLSPGMGELLGWARVARQSTWAEAMRVIPDDERSYVDSIWTHAVMGEPFEFQHRMLHRDGSRRIVLERGAVTAVVDGKPTRAVAVVQDITAQREAEMLIEELRSQHEVTGLPNRAALLDRLDEAINASRWNPCHVAVLVLEVDQIESIAESIGFGAGDTLSMAIASRLSEQRPQGWELAHVGRGEFVLTSRQGGAFEHTALIATATEVSEILAAPVMVGRNEISPSVSVGIACFPDDAQVATALLENAQTARASAADSSIGRIAFFHHEISDANLRRLDIETNLRKAIENGQEFSLRFQPILELGSGRIHAVEAFLRWNSPLLGMVSPSEFIPIAEKSDLILGIGEWVLRTSCEQLAAWNQGPASKLRLWINLSARDIARPDLADFVQRTIIETGAAPSRLGFDISEGALGQGVGDAAPKLQTLHAAGIGLALDDFGTGFSSLSLLRTLPIDLIKVDRSYINDVTASLEEVSLTRAIIRMTHSMQMKVVAEGVETDSQLGLLIADDCDYAQGRVFSDSVDADALAAMVAEGKRLPDSILRHAERPRTLLLVDDEANILSALKRLLRREGYKILTAESAAEGLIKLTENDVDVIVSDQRMPGMTGVEFLRKAKELYPDTVRLVLSGYTELQSITDAINEGAIYKFLTKPWDDERLVVHVREAFEQKQMADENRRLNNEVHAAYQELANAKSQVETLLEAERRRNALEDARARNSQDMLEAMPVALIGVDTSGLLAYLNSAAELLLPNALSALGQDARAILPADLCAALGSTSDASVAVTIHDRRYQVLTRALHGETGQRGTLLTLVATESETA